ncbi:MAG: peptidase [Verrucomicrobiales bacterium]|nr:peptidase [Verrucomicrobiales bacterium]
MEQPPKLPLLTLNERRDLVYAKLLLENPGLTARLAQVLGSPIEKGLKMLPANFSELVQKATRTALNRALDVAIATIGGKNPRRSSERFHKLLAGAAGGIGGIFGLASLPLELPVSTAIMLRSIADIARSEGHDLGTVEVKLDCLEVFALGSKGANAAESGYWAVRTALARAVAEAASYAAEKGVLDKSAPVMIRLVGSIAARFGIVVSEEVAAKAVPIIGAASGSVINVLFINHFQDMARGHFIVRRLERIYGTENVREEYLNLPAALVKR